MLPTDSSEEMKTNENFVSQPEVTVELR